MASAPLNPRSETGEPVDGARFAAAVESALVRHIYALQKVGLPGNIAAVVLAAVLQWNVAPPDNLLFWSTFATVVFIARISLGIAFLRQARATGDVERWLRPFLAASLFGGLIWAMYGFFLFPYGGPQHETASVTLLLGLAAGGVTTLSAFRLAYLLYVVPTLLPLLILFGTGGETPHWILFTGVLVYLLFLIGSSRHMNRSIVDGFQRRFALDALVADLTAAHEQANTANAHLNQVLTEQSAILEAATVGIAYVRDGMLQKSNPRMNELFAYGIAPLPSLPFRALGILPSAEEADCIDSALAGGRSHEGDHDVVRRDESHFWCHIKATPIDRADPSKGAIWIFVDVQDRVEADRRIRHLAHHDPLTGLPNRILLRDRLAMALAQARRHELIACLLLVDLDRFKDINDTLGHAAGDAVLIEVGRRIADCVREGDTVARQGGDEFVVVLGGLRSREHCAGIARKLIDALSAAVPYGAHAVSVGASIGIAVFPDDALDADRLLKCADAAMYRIKAAGGNGFCYYTDAQGGVQNTGPSTTQP